MISGQLWRLLAEILLKLAPEFRQLKLVSRDACFDKGLEIGQLSNGSTKFSQSPIIGGFLLQCFVQVSSQRHLGHPRTSSHRAQNVCKVTSMTIIDPWEFAADQIDWRRETIVTISLVRKYFYHKVGLIADKFKKVVQIFKRRSEILKTRKVTLNTILLAAYHRSTHLPFDSLPTKIDGYRGYERRHQISDKSACKAEPICARAAVYPANQSNYPNRQGKEGNCAAGCKGEQRDPARGQSTFHAIIQVSVARGGRWRL